MTRLLLIEDDQSIAEVLTDILREAGYSVERAASRTEALALLAAQGRDAFDLVLTRPFWVPQGDPYGWLDQVRANTTAPVVICARAPQSRYMDCRERGFAAFLPEPFDREQVVSLVETLCPPANAAIPAFEASDLVPRLTAEFHFSPARAARLAHRLASADPRVKRAFWRWWQTGAVDTTLEVGGYTAAQLVAQRRLHPLAAFATLDWLIREPECAALAIQRGYHRITIATA